MFDFMLETLVAARFSFVWRSARIALVSMTAGTAGIGGRVKRLSDRIGIYYADQIEIRAKEQVCPSPTRDTSVSSRLVHKMFCEIS
jgi:hypothetical protein